MTDKITHDLSAVDLTITRGWHDMSTFPRDGTTVEVADAHENTGTGKWWGGQVATLVSHPVKWRRREHPAWPLGRDIA